MSDFEKESFWRGFAAEAGRWCSLHALGPGLKCDDDGVCFPSRLHPLLLYFQKLHFAKHLLSPNIRGLPIAHNATEQEPHSLAANTCPTNNRREGAALGCLGPWHHFWRAHHPAAQTVSPPNPAISSHHTQKFWALITKENLITNLPSNTQTHTSSPSSKFIINNLRPKIFQCHIFIPNGSQMWRCIGKQNVGGPMWLESRDAGLGEQQVVCGFLFFFNGWSKISFVVKSHGDVFVVATHTFTDVSAVFGAGEHSFPKCCSQILWINWHRNVRHFCSFSIFTGIPLRSMIPRIPSSASPFLTLHIPWWFRFLSARRTPRLTSPDQALGATARLWVKSVSSLPLGSFFLFYTLERRGDY